MSFLNEDLRGEMIEEMIEEAREVRLGLVSSESTMFRGRCLPIFFEEGEPSVGAGPALRS